MYLWLVPEFFSVHVSSHFRDFFNLNKSIDYFHIERREDRFWLKTHWKRPAAPDQKIHINNDAFLPLFATLYYYKFDQMASGD